MSKLPMTVFLYTLMRDHLPPGKVEELMQEAERAYDYTITFTNDHLAAYALELSNRLSLKEEDNETQSV